MGSRLRLWVWALPLIIAAGVGILIKRDDGLEWPPSLDFFGGVRLEYEIDNRDAIRKGLDDSAALRQALERSQEVFLFRLRRFDLSEITIKPVGDNRLVLEVPGTKAIENVKAEIGNAAVLTFRLVLDPRPRTRAEVAEMSLEERASYFYYSDYGAYLKVGEPLLDASGISHSGTRVQTMNPTVENPNPGPHIRLALRSGSRDKFAQLTTEHYEKQLAICLDERIESAPKIAAKGIKEPIITGDYTKTDAQNMVKILRAGPLPVSLNLTREVLVSPSLGKEAYSRGLRALMMGLAFVAVVLWLAYSDRPEMITTFVVCLVLEVALIFIMGHLDLLTLNMISLSGVIVLLGISVDNLILIFEEYRSILSEEASYRVLEIIKTMGKAFQGEIGIILLANLTTGLVLLPLFLLQGPITDLVTIMFLGLMVALLVNVWYARHLLSSEAFVAPLNRISPFPRPLLSIRVNLFSARTVLLGIYAVAIAFSLYSLKVRWIEWGLDFEGGTEISIVADEGLDVEALGSQAAAYFGERCEIKRVRSLSGEEDESFQYVIRVPRGEQLAAGEEAERVATGGSSDVDSAPTAEGFVGLLRSELPMAIRLEAVSLLGATVVPTNRKVVLASVVIAIVILMITIGTTYGGRYVWPVILALIFDGLITMGAISWFGVALSIPVIAAVLTVIGYSINDSIVLCGHVHRDMGARLSFLQKLSLEELRRFKTDLQPLLQDRYSLIVKRLSPRVLLTTLTTAGVAVSLALVGRGMLRDFGLVIAVGAIFGTVSSVSLVVTMLQRSPHPDVSVKLTEELARKEQREIEGYRMNWSRNALP